MMFLLLSKNRQDQYELKRYEISNLIVACIVLEAVLYHLLENLLLAVNRFELS